MLDISELVGHEMSEKEIKEETRYQKGRGGGVARCHRACKNTAKTHRLFTILDFGDAYCHSDPDSSYGNDHYVSEKQILCHDCYSDYINNMRTELNRVKL